MVRAGYHQLGAVEHLLADERRWVAAIRCARAAQLRELEQLSQRCRIALASLRATVDEHAAHLTKAGTVDELLDVALHRSLIDIARMQADASTGSLHARKGHDRVVCGAIDDVRGMVAGHFVAIVSLDSFLSAELAKHEGARQRLHEFDAGKGGAAIGFGGALAHLMQMEDEFHFYAPPALLDLYVEAGSQAADYWLRDYLQNMKTRLRSGAARRDDKTGFLKADILNVLNVPGHNRSFDGEKDKAHRAGR